MLYYVNAYREYTSISTVSHCMLAIFRKRNQFRSYQVETKIAKV